MHLVRAQQASDGLEPMWSGRMATIRTFMDPRCCTHTYLRNYQGRRTGRQGRWGKTGRREDGMFRILCTDGEVNAQNVREIARNCCECCALTVRPAHETVRKLRN